MPPILRAKLGCHGLEAATMEQIQKQRLDDVIAMMPSAILLMPFSPANRYSAPRRSREHSEHIVRPRG